MTTSFNIQIVLEDRIMQVSGEWVLEYDKKDFASQEYQEDDYTFDDWVGTDPRDLADFVFEIPFEEISKVWIKVADTPSTRTLEEMWRDAHTSYPVYG